MPRLYPGASWVPPPRAAPPCPCRLGLGSHSPALSRPAPWEPKPKHVHATPVRYRLQKTPLCDRNLSHANTSRRVSSTKASSSSHVQETALGLPGALCPARARLAARRARRPRASADTPRFLRCEQPLARPQPEQREARGTVGTCRARFPEHSAARGLVCFRNRFLCWDAVWLP